MRPIEVRPLGQLARLQAGVGFPLELQGKKSGAYPLAKVGDISRVGRSGSATLEGADHFVDEADLARLKTRPIPKGSVLFAKIGEAIRQNHRVIAGRDVLVDNNAMAAIPLEGTVPEYLYHYLRTVDFYQLASVTTVPALKKSELERLPVPWLPSPDQSRIAEILDRADNLRAKRRAALALLDTLAQSIFLDLFGDGVDDRWPTALVSEYVERFEGGKSLEADASETDTRNRVLKISAVTGMEFRPAESKPVPDEYEPPQDHFVRAGDLLFSRANTTELVGAIALVGETPSNLLLPDKLWRFMWGAPPKVHPQFIWALFQTRRVREEIQRRATGTSGSMKNISQEKLLGIRTMLPPLPLQQTFATRIAAVEKLKAAHRASLTELDALFASLQHRAFRGEL